MINCISELEPEISSRARYADKIEDLLIEDIIDLDRKRQPLILNLIGGAKVIDKLGGHEVFIPSYTPYGDKIELLDEVGEPTEGELLVAIEPINRKVRNGSANQKIWPIRDWLTRGRVAF